MRSVLVLGLLGLPLVSAAVAGGQAAKAARTVQLTGDDTMHYNMTTITARPGERLHIVLKDVGTMPKIVMGHNVVVLQQGTDAVAFTTAGMQARATDFIPAEMKDTVLAATPMAGPGETVDVTFTAPLKRGGYLYLCSFPGHYAAGMHGTLTVR